MFEPFKPFAPLSGIARQPSYQLTPEEESNLLASIGGGLLSGVGWLGETLGKGGAAVRGVVSGFSGGPKGFGGGLLNLIPLSDTLGITHSEDKVTGTDLREQMGLDTGSGIGNFAADVGIDLATDPMTFLGGLFGSGFGKSGRLLKKAGIEYKVPGLGVVESKQTSSIAKTLQRMTPEARAVAEGKLLRVAEKSKIPLGEGADFASRMPQKLLDAPLGGLANIGLFGAPTMTVGTTSKPAVWAGQKIDELMSWTRGTFPVRLAAGALGKRYGDKVGLTDQAVQSARFDKLPEAARQAADAAFRFTDDIAGLTKLTEETFGPEVAGLVGKGQQTLPGVPFKVGDVVRAADRENYGWVRDVTPARTHVYFENPETGMTALKQFPHEELSLAHAAGTPEAAQYSQSMLTKLLDKTTRMLAEHTENAPRTVVDIWEKVFPGTKAFPGLGKKFAESKVGEEAQRIATEWKAANRTLLDEGVALGLDRKLMPEELTAHAPRFVDSRKAVEEAARQNKVISLAHPSDAGRAKVTRELPWDIRNEILADKATRTPEAILAKYGDWLGTGYTSIPGKAGEAATEIPLEIARLQHADELAKYLGESGHVPYTHSYLRDQTLAAKRAYTINETARVVHKMVGDNLIANPTYGTTVPLTDAMKELGIKPTHGMRMVSKLAGKQLNELKRMNVPVEVMDALRGQHPDAIAAVLSGKLQPQSGMVGLEQAFKDMRMIPENSLAHLSTVTGKPVAVLKAMAIPADLSQSLRGLMEPQVNTALGSAFGQWWDKLTGFIKQTLFTIWPSSHSRDLMSSQLMNAMSGTIESPADFLAYFASVKKAASLARGKGDAATLRALQKFGVTGHKFGFEDSPIAMKAGSEVLPASPFAVKEAWKESGKYVAENSSFLPFLDKRPGVATARQAMGTATRIGSSVHGQSDFLGRVSQWLYLTEKKGWDEAAAASKVKAIHFDYDNMTAFERSYAKRLFPFWTYTKNFIPFLAQTLLDRPGGFLASTIKTIGKNRTEKGDILPPHVSQSLAIPMGAGPSGAERFFTTGGMGWEDTGAFLSGASGGVAKGLQGGLMEGISRLHPLLKGPIELASNRSFFQRGPGGGRQLTDLDPALGRTIANVTGEPKLLNLGPLGETVLANSPVSRVLSTARTMTDRRKELWAKGLNLLTPFKVTDVTEGATDAMVREATTDLMRKMPGAKDFTRVNVPDEKLALLPPEEQQQYKEYQALLTKLSKKSKERHRQRDLQFLLP